ncbi:MAG: tyrosine-type recombinase/integrase, partial [Anaerolineae bacterium]|nr:tyrosine-type recombinase/integrase [Anaerolineae bacterium]
DLDWGGQQVFVRHGKGGRQRYAMVPAPTWAALKAYLDTERPEPPTDKDAADIPLFVVLGGPRRGQPLTAAAVQSLFRRQRQRAQTPNVTPHRLRHTCGTHLHQAGMALEFLQEQLGHRRLDSTRLYVHLSNDRLRAAYLAAQAQFYQPTEDQEEPHGSAPSHQTGRPVGSGVRPPRGLRGRVTGNRGQRREVPLVRQAPYHPTGRRRFPTGQSTVAGSALSERMRPGRLASPPSRRPTRPAPAPTPQGRGRRDARLRLLARPHSAPPLSPGPP